MSRGDELAPLELRCSDGSSQGLVWYLAHGNKPIAHWSTWVELARAIIEATAPVVVSDRSVSLFVLPIANDAWRCNRCGDTARSEPYSLHRGYGHDAPFFTAAAAKNPRGWTILSGVETSLQFCPVCSAHLVGERSTR